MTQTVPATAVLGPGKTGLAVGLRVLNLDGTEYAAFSTTGVSETSMAGTYRKAGGVVCPDAGGYIVFGVAGTDYAEATVDSVYGLITGTKTTLDSLLLALQGAGSETLASLAATLTGIKGAGWTTETLVALDVLLDAIKARTDLLGAGTVSVVSPVAADGDVSIDRGYDYYTADGRGLAWTDETPATWPNLTGATATLYVGTLSVAGVITNPTGPATITVELSRVQTAALAQGVHPFHIDVTLTNTHLILQVRGTMTVS